MIKNIFTHWRTTAPGVLAIVTGASTFIALVIDKNLTATTATSLIMGILTGVGLLYSQDYTQGDKAHAESQAQIAQLQLRSNIVPNAIDSGDTSMLRRAPITPAATPVVAPPDVVAMATPPNPPVIPAGQPNSKV